MEVIVLNLNYDFLSTISWKRAMTLITSDKAEILKNSDKTINTPNETWFIPAIIRILKFVRSVYKKAVPLSRNNVFNRDNHTCQYCGAKTDLTLDHVIPKSRGGKHSWENLVTSCSDCNVTKRNRTPSESSMFLKRQPYRPTVMEFLMKLIRNKNLERFVYELFEK